jgi:3-oxoacyl-[acyl-carrier protein] reductase
MMVRIPLRHWVEPDENGGRVCLFAFDTASYVTGQVLPVDGSMVM